MEFLNFEGLAYFKNKENSQIAPVESTTTASQAYEIGQYFWYEGKLYEATAAIALGDTFVTSGDSANCELADIADDISDARGRISTLEGQVTDLETNKANIDGYYSEMTVGNAEQIVSTVGVEDKTPYNFRTAGGSVDIGDREEDTVVGGTVAWNQLVTTDTNVSKTKSGDIVTVEDAVAGNAQELVVNFEPQQDLHGYDSPWPAGGGKQLFDKDNPSVINAYISTDNANIVSNSNHRTVYVPCKPNTTYTAQKIAQEISDDRFYVAYSNDLPANGVNVYGTTGKGGNFVVGQKYSYSVTTGAEAQYIVVWVSTATAYANSIQTLMIEEGNVASDYAPYSNICPITGWTGCDAYRTGVNVWDEEWESGSYNNTTGEKEPNSGYIRSANAIPVLPSTSYRTSINPAGGMWFGFYDANGTYLSKIDTAGGVITTPADTYFMRFHTYGGYGTTYNNDISINYPSTDTAYHAYYGTTYPVSWQSEAGTVYGGTWNPVSGVLTVTEKKIILGNNAASSIGETDAGIKYAVTTTYDDAKIYSLCLSDRYKQFTGINANNTVRIIGKVLYVYDNRITDLESAKTLIAGTEVVYELATSTEIQLTPQQIALLAGTNNVWNDIGSTQMTYLGTLNEITAQSGHKYLTRVNGSSTVVNGSGQTLSGEKARDNIFDLTQMFGSSIADYIYSLENTSSGEGVSWFTDLFPKPYYSYNAGQLMSVNTSAHKTVGFNAWDEQWEKGTYNTTTGNPQSSNSQIRCKNDIPMVGGSVYYCYKGGRGAIWGFFLDANKTVMTVFDTPSGASRVGNAFSANGKLFTTPEGCRYFRFYATDTYGSTYGNNICINLSWDGERDGEYEAYEEHTYALDESLTLRGIPKLDSGNKLYYDGDTYEDDGTVTRKYGIVDLGTLTWYTQSSVHIFKSSAVPGMKTQAAYYRAINMLCTKYSTGTVNSMPQADKEITCTINSSELRVRDDGYDSVNDFASALSGVYLVYELATPTTEEADPYTNPQIVSDWGTEEYVDYSVLSNEREVSIPVGHVTVYQNNLRAKLEMAPESPSDGDGDYIVRQTNGENEYVKLIIPNELPEAPTETGTYILQVTISNGTATYSWVSE